MNGDIIRDLYDKVEKLNSRLENVEALLHAVCTTDTVQKEVTDGPITGEGSDRREEPPKD
jgi:N-acetylglutamate synthase/N-acetylornithine aminotransferase